MITVSYGHADKLAAIAAAGAPAGSTKPAPLIDPALYRRDDVRPIVAERDIAALYLILKDEGVTQRQIAELTGQSQSEVSEILDGRKVLSYDLLVRIAEGLRIAEGTAHPPRTHGPLLRRARRLRGGPCQVRPAGARPTPASLASLANSEPSPTPPNPHNPASLVPAPLAGRPEPINGTISTPWMSNTTQAPHRRTYRDIPVPSINGVPLSGKREPGKRVGF